MDAQEDRYLDLLGDWPQDKIKAKLAGVRKERSDASGQLANLSSDLDTGRQVFADALDLLADPYELYRQLPDPERRLMTLTIFGKLEVDTKQIVGHELRPPFSELLDYNNVTLAQPKAAGVTRDSPDRSTPGGKPCSPN